MRKLFFALALLCASAAQGQQLFTAPTPFWQGVPTGAPSSQGARVRFDVTAGRWYSWTGSVWTALPWGIATLSGNSAPNYTPGVAQSPFALVLGTQDLYFYTGPTATDWDCLNCVDAPTYTAGEGIAIDGTTIRIDTLDRLTFNQSPTLGGGIGTFRWNDTDGTLDLGLKGGNVTLQLGQETVHRAVNKHGSTIANGEVVRVYGAQGNRLAVRKASAAADSLSQSTLGVATEDISNNQEGFITAQGLVRGLNTSGFTEGEPLYLSATTPGALTQTAPTAPSRTVLVGYCVRSHATVGSIWVDVRRGFNLGELHDVSTSAATNGQVLTYNSSTKVWSGATVADQSATNELQTLSVATNTATLSNSGSSVTIAGAGINTASTAGTTITLTATEVDGSVTNEAQTLSVSGTTNPTVSLSTAGGAGGGSVQLQGGGNTAVTQAANVVTISSTGGSPAGSTGQVQFNNAGAFGASSNLTFATATGKLRTTSPANSNIWLELDPAAYEIRSFATGSHESRVQFAAGGIRFLSDNNTTPSWAIQSTTPAFSGLNNSSLSSFNQMSFTSDMWPVGNKAFSFTTYTNSGSAVTHEKMWIGIGEQAPIALNPNGGVLAINQSSGTSAADINGTNGYSQLRLRTTYTPTSTADALGNTGDTAWDANFFYIKTAAGWKRAALSTF